MRKLAISEVFYSIQGEGKTAGFPAVFVRLGGCNLMCGGMGTQFTGELMNGATFRCDTLEVWMNAQAKPIDEVLDDECIEALTDGANLIVTGGEPTMQQEAVVDLIQYVREFINPEVYVEIETNGTIMPSDALFREIDQWNVSPKLSNSGNSRNQTYQPEVIKGMSRMNAVFKFVVTTDSEWEEIKADYMPIIKREQVWLMPSGEDQKLLAESAPNVAEICKRERLKYTSRLHIDIWNKKTGV